MAWREWWGLWPVKDPSATFHHGRGQDGSSVESMLLALQTMEMAQLQLCSASMEIFQTPAIRLSSNPLPLVVVSMAYGYNYGIRYRRRRMFSQP